MPRVYEVKENDSPATIAALFAGCPKCAADLIPANPHKPTATMPNGFTTFRALRAGEKINLPEKWFSPGFERLPPAYFAALPYADGVTRGSLGALGDYPDLDVATGKVGALAAMDDSTFNRSVGDAGASIDASVKEAYGSGNAQAAQLAQTVQDGTKWAWNRNNDLTAAIQNGDANVINAVRLDVMNALSTALGNAKLALGAYYGPSAPTVVSVPVVTRPGYPAAVTSAAQAAAAAIGADAGYCASVARPGTAVNSAVHAFKSAWNSAFPSAAVPIGTGTYEAATAGALAQVLGNSPAACGAAAPQPQRFEPIVAPVATTSTGGLSTGAVAGIGVLTAGAVGGIAWAATRKRGPRVRRYA